MITAERYHDISCGHRVVGHEGKCRHLHGHNYRIHFSVQAENLDEIGRVLDFGIIKDKLCMWLEDNWDHKFLAWEKDSLMTSLYLEEFKDRLYPSDLLDFSRSVVWLSFNPTAENMAEYLVNIIGPQQLLGTGCTLVKVVIEETRKCSVSFIKE